MSRTSNRVSTTRTNGEGGPSLTTGQSKSGLVVTIDQRTTALVRGLDLVLEHHDAPIEIREELKIQLHSYLDSSEDETVWLKRCKYALCYPLAKYLRNELPPAPDRVFVPTGCLRRWMKTRFNAFNRANTHFWYSWFQSKRSTLPLSEDIIESTYEKHLETLTKVDQGDDIVIKQIFRNSAFLKVLWNVRAEITEKLSISGCFENGFDDEFRGHHMPSKSACFSRTRGSGGQQMSLRLLSGLPTYDKEDYPNLSDPVELYSMVYRPWVYSRQGVLSNFQQSQYCDYGHLEWQELAKAVRKLDLTKPLNCTIQAVLEPNKVRVISKGEALPYYSCKPLQKVMHSALKSWDPFRLIGRPLCPTDIMDLQENASPTDKWFSVDYSAATDGLSWKYSGQIFRFLIADLPKHQQDVALSVLGPHSLYYPVKGGRGDIELRGVQQNGQLMGSILSFPILCMANLGVYCLANHERMKSWSVDEVLRHVLINGDDMVYAAPEEIWKAHVDIGRKVGLEMSVGKAYIHAEYLNVNSTSVHCNLRRMDTPYQVGYLNSGLFFGQHKVQGRTETRSDVAQAHMTGVEDGLVVNLNTLLAGAKPGKECDLLKKFLKVHSEQITQECRSKTFRGKHFSRNLFIPLNLGGMGVKAPLGWKWKVTKEELYVANGLLTLNPACAYSTQRPLPGYDLGTTDSIVAQPWSLTEKSDFEIARVPIKRISFPLLRTIVRTGMIFWGPHRGVLRI